MRNFSFLLILFPLLSACVSQRSPQLASRAEVERILKALSSDEMEGRAVFTPGIERAAGFIEQEFRDIGLLPLNGETSFRQSFSKTRISPGVPVATINGRKISSSKLIVLSNRRSLHWDQGSGVEVQVIKAGQSFISRYKAIVGSGRSALVFVDPRFANAFRRVRQYAMRERLIEGSEADSTAEAVFILGSAPTLRKYAVSFSNEMESSPLFNVAGVIPGKSRSDEYVIFSAHYDHLGIIEPLKGDSIANGADDDASGVTAVISLASYFKRLAANERTLIFVAFTAEETGLVGSKYFASKIKPEAVVAMINVEMIGRKSKFGRNSAFITGYERSDFAEILQKNLRGKGFQFHADPYPGQGLFYRSDNASLASTGVPAHTISTVQIDKDDFYHSVDDEFGNLNIETLRTVIKAVAAGTESIITGEDTPKRIPPSERRRDSF